MLRAQTPFSSPNILILSSNNFIMKNDLKTAKVIKIFTFMAENDKDYAHKGAFRFDFSFKLYLVKN